MSWAKVDDRFFSHPKTLKCSKDAKLLFLCGLTYCAANMTDGFIPDAASRVLIATIEAEESSIEELISVRYWLKTNGGYQVKDYLEYNPSKAQREEERRKTADRVAAWRAKQQSDLVTPLQTPLVTLLVTPLESESESEKEKESLKVKSIVDSANRGMRLQNPFEAPDDWLEFARKERPDIDPDLEVQKFADYWHAVPGVKGRKLDWPATWRNWIRNAKQSSNGHAANGKTYARQLAEESAQRALARKAIRDARKYENGNP